jgi:hypothetical protein
VKKSFVTLNEKSEARAKAEALDADLKRSTAAMEEVLQERFQAAGTADVFLNLADLAVSKLFPARADRRVVAQSMQKEFDFAESKTHVTCEANQKHAFDGIAGVTALPASAVRSGEKTHFLVVADGRCIEARATGELSDFHGVLTDLTIRKKRLDLKLTLTFTIR